MTRAFSSQEKQMPTVNERAIKGTVSREKFLNWGLGEMVCRAGRASLKCFRVCAHFSNSVASRVFVQISCIIFRASEGFASSPIASAFLLCVFFASVIFAHTPPLGFFSALWLAFMCVGGGRGGASSCPLARIHIVQGNNAHEKIKIFLY